MAHTVAEILDYVAYANGRGQVFEYIDFEAEDVRTPRALRHGAVVFPTGWPADKKARWRKRHRIGIPEALARLRATEGRRNYDGPVE
jgi:hypothetical protein